MSKKYEFDSAKFLSASGLAWQAALKKTKVKLDLSTDIDMLLMVEKLISGEISYSVHWYAEDNKKYMKDHDKNKESSCFQYWDKNNVYAWAMSQKLPVNNIPWIEDKKLWWRKWWRIFSWRWCSVSLKIRQS